jgi:RNA polymerase sigma factor (sigma-70 family)
MEKYFNDVKKYKILLVEEQLNLFNEKKYIELFNSNLRLVIKIAKELAPHQLEDAIQEGNIGLWNGINTFNGTGNILSWFNMNIRWEIMDYLTQNNNTVRIPKNKIVEKVRVYTQSTSTEIKDGYTIQDLIIDDIEEYDNSNEVFLNDLRHFISKMKDKYQKVFILRYFKGKTYQEIGNELNCTKQNVEQIDKKIIKLFKDKMMVNPFIK